MNTELKIHTKRAKCHLSGAPAERLFHHEDAQHLYGSSHCRAVQHSSCKQQNHVRLVYHRRSHHRIIIGAAREEVALLPWLFVGYLFHLELRRKHTRLTSECAVFSSKDVCFSKVSVRDKRLKMWL